MLASQCGTVMSGGQIQLVSTGSADILLTGNPEVTFWKSVWRRHTAFAVEAVEQSFNTTTGFGRRCSVTLSRIGDLVHRVWLQVRLPALPPPYKYTNAIGLALIKAVEVEVGGTVLDHHKSEFLDIWSELSNSDSKRKGYNKLVGRFDDWDPSDDTKSLGAKETTVMVPLNFFFNNESGSALLMVAIVYHSTRINLEFQSLERLVVSSDPIVTSIPSQLGTAYNPLDAEMRMYADMVFLETAERRRWAKMAHEILMTQVQSMSEDVIMLVGNPQRNRRYTLPFSQPIKELIFVYYPADTKSTDGKPLFFYYKQAFDDVRILVNKQDMQSTRPAMYFTHAQPWQQHTRVPDKPIYCYSFALQPEAMQPSGSLNANSITLELQFTVNLPERSVGKLLVLAISYNVLRIANGLAGMSFTNGA